MKNKINKFGKIKTLVKKEEREKIINDFTADLTKRTEEIAKKIPNIPKRSSAKEKTNIKEVSKEEQAILDFIDFADKEWANDSIVTKEFTFMINSKDYDFSFLAVLMEEKKFDYSIIDDQPEDKIQALDLLTLKEVLEKISLTYDFYDEYIVYRKYKSKHLTLNNMRKTWTDQIDEYMNALIDHKQSEVNGHEKSSFQLEKVNGQEGSREFSTSTDSKYHLVKSYKKSYQVNCIDNIQRNTKYKLIREYDRKYITKGYQGFLAYQLEASKKAYIDEIEREWEKNAPEVEFSFSGIKLEEVHYIQNLLGDVKPFEISTIEIVDNRTKEGLDIDKLLTSLNKIVQTYGVWKSYIESATEISSKITKASLSAEWNIQINIYLKELHKYELSITENKYKLQTRYLNHYQVKRECKMKYKLRKKYDRKCITKAYQGFLTSQLETSKRAYVDEVERQWNKNTPEVEFSFSDIKLEEVHYIQNVLSEAKVFDTSMIVKVDNNIKEGLDIDKLLASLDKIVQTYEVWKSYIENETKISSKITKESLSTEWNMQLNIYLEELHKYELSLIENKYKLQTRYLNHYQVKRECKTKFNLVKVYQKAYSILRNISVPKFVLQKKYPFRYSLANGQNEKIICPSDLYYEMNYEGNKAVGKLLDMYEGYEAQIAYDIYKKNDKLLNQLQEYKFQANQLLTIWQNIDIFGKKEQLFKELSENTVPSVQALIKMERKYPGSIDKFIGYKLPSFYINNIHTNLDVEEKMKIIPKKEACILELRYGVKSNITSTKETLLIMDSILYELNHHWSKVSRTSFTNEAKIKKQMKEFSEYLNQNVEFFNKAKYESCIHYIESNMVKDDYLKKSSSKEKQYNRLLIAYDTILEAFKKDMSELEEIANKHKLWDEKYQGKVLTLEETGNMFDVTRERVRQMETKALRKISIGDMETPIRKLGLSKLTLKLLDTSYEEEKEVVFSDVYMNEYLRNKYEILNDNVIVKGELVKASTRSIYELLWRTSKAPELKGLDYYVEQFNQVISNDLISLDKDFHIYENRILEGYLNRSKDTIKSESFTYRYWDKSDKELFEELESQIYEQEDIFSVRKIFDENKFIMDKYDIQVYDELHYVLKRYVAELEVKGIKKDINFLRTPHISLIGKDIKIAEWVADEVIKTELELDEAIDEVSLKTGILTQTIRISYLPAVQNKIYEYNHEDLNVDEKVKFQAILDSLPIGIYSLELLCQENLYIASRRKKFTYYVRKNTDECGFFMKRSWLIRNQYTSIFNFIKENSDANGLFKESMLLGNEETNKYKKMRRSYIKYRMAFRFNETNLLVLNHELKVKLNKLDEEAYQSMVFPMTFELFIESEEFEKSLEKCRLTTYGFGNVFWYSYFLSREDFIFNNQGTILYRNIYKIDYMSMFEESGKSKMLRSKFNEKIENKYGVDISEKKKEELEEYGMTCKGDYVYESRKIYIEELKEN